MQLKSNLLIAIAIQHLKELNLVLKQISEKDYLKPLNILSQSTIGKHTRHILEFFECLFSADNLKTICYEDRKRNLLLEENIRYTLDAIIEIMDKLEHINLDNNLILKVKHEQETILIATSLDREIVYNIEHTVHHLAIIKIAIISSLTYIQIPDNFGFSISTLNFLSTQKAN